MNYQNDNHKEDEVRENAGNIKKIYLLAAGGILATALLIGGIGLAGCHGKQETEKETVSSHTAQTDDNITNEVKEELTSISEYLTQLDTEIMNNQSELDKVMGSNAEIGEQTVVELEKIQDLYKNLYSKMSGYEQKFLHYVENYTDVTTGTNTGIVTLQTTLAETKEKLVETEERITNTLQMIENGQVTRQEKLLEQLTTVKDHISETEKLIEKVEKSTQDVLKEMEKEISKQHTEVIGTLEKIQSDLSGEIAEDMEEIGKSLSSLDSSLTNTITEKTDALKVQMETTLSEIRTEFLQVDESLKKADNTFLAFWGDYAEDIEKSNIRLNDIDDALVRAGMQLSETKEQLTDMLTEMENTDALRQEETEKKLTDLQTAMEETKEYVRLAEEQIGKTLDSMSEQQKADQVELVTTLTDIKDTILQSVENGIIGLTETLASQKAEMEVSLEEKTAEIRELTGAVLTELKGEFEKAEEEFNAYEKTFESFTVEYRADAEEVDVKLDEIGASITSTKEQLASAKQNLSDTLSEMEANAGLRYEELSGKTVDILNAVSDAKEQVKVVGEQIAQTLNGMSEQQKADHAELVKMLEGIGTGTEQTFEKIDTGFETLQNGMGAGFASLQENMDVSVNSLRSQMDDIHTKITDTQTEIKEILAGMDEKSVEQYEEMMEAIEEAVEDINSDVNSAHDNLQALIRIQNADMAENHRDTLDTLENMETNMSVFLSQNMEEINASFSSLNSELSNYFSQVQEGQGNLGEAVDDLDAAMGNLGTELKTVLQTVLDAISGHDKANKDGQEAILNIISDHASKSEMGHAGIESKIDTHNTAMLSYLDAFKNEVNQNLEQVFQSVSNGKKLVVSALLTKGVSIESDATFADIYQKILDIPQEIVVGEQQLPGTISYEYHYHKDGNSNLTHDTTSKVSGGCYSDTKHQDYEVIGTREEERTGTTQTTGACGCGNTGYTLTAAPCPSCGHHHWGKGCVQEVTKTVTYTYKVPVNIYGWVEKDFYDLICGFSDGQIIGATIIYDNAAVSSASIMKMTRPMVEESETEIAVGPDGIPEGAVIIEEIIVTEGTETENEEVSDGTEDPEMNEEPESEVQPEEEAEAQPEVNEGTVSENTTESGEKITPEETDTETEVITDQE